ncbi:MAG: InlB B-repeat-containing protein, partial [Eubacteriales bacterium]
MFIKKNRRLQCVFLSLVLVLNGLSLSVVLAESSPVGVTYQSHVQNIGWQNAVSDGATSGTTGQSLRLEAIKINLVNAPEGAGIKYQSHIQNIGWGSLAADGAMSGTTGHNLRLEAIKISLVNMPGYSVQYRVHVQSIGWMNWVSNGEVAGTTGRSLQIEAIEIKVFNETPYTITFNSDGGTAVPSITQAYGTAVTVPADPTKEDYTFAGWDPAIPATMPEGGAALTARWTINHTITSSLFGVNYQSHVQNIGWQNTVADGATAGTSGQSLRMEAIRINLVNPPAGAGIEYQAHVQDIGWQNAVADGSTAGTTGQSLRIEAMRISLVNMPGFSVQYRAYVQDIGWMNWVSDGQVAGTTGRNLRMEACAIRVINVSQNTITFNSDGGSAVPSITQAYGTNVTAPADPTKEGYTFAGWSPAIPATMPAGGASLTAQWTANNYSVTYNANGGTGTQTDSTVYHIGNTVTVKNQGTIAYTGYTFNGWNTADNGSGTAYAPSATFTMGSASVTLYAQWTANNYSVTYNANGGTGTQTDSTVYHIGNTVTVKNQGTMAYTGYTFAGWNTAANGSGTSYAPAATFTMGSASVALYAQWTANNYAVTYDANGGTGTQTDSTVYHIGNTVTVRDQGTMAYTGYTFAGWNTAANGSGTAYAPAATFTMGSASVTLYAQWTANNYSVTYNANGGTGTQTDSTVYHIGNTVTVRDQGTMAYTGYTFTGWNTVANGSGTAYTPSATFTMGSASVTLYAQWTANNYSVTYNANGGTGTQTDSTVYHIGNTVTVKNQGTMAYTGCTFAGWNTLANGSGTSYAVGATFTMGSTNVTLYAQWINNYSVTYNANGGTGTQTDSAVYHVGDTVTVKNQGTMAYTGYTFAGWNTLANGSGTSYAAGATFTMGSTGVTLYAQWTANNYSVTYNANGGTGTQTDSTVYHIGNTVTVKNQGTMAYTGYSLAGWNTLANGSGTSYAVGATFTMGSANVTLYAQWTANNYAVTYDANGGTGTQTDSAVYHIGDTVTVKNQGTMAYTGYTFAVWNTAANGSGTSYSPAATFTMGGTGVTLYAQWTANNYSVTYNANGGTGTQTDSTVYHIGNTVTVKNQGTMAYTGYSLAGWNTAANGSGTSYAVGATFTMGSANVTLYAQWTANNYSVTYNANSGTGTQTDSTVYHIGDTVTVKNQGTMAYTGYTFAGWNTAANGSGTSYAPSATFTMGSTGVTLYAQWTANDYAVTYDANGATGTQTDSTVYHIGNTVTVKNQGTMTFTGCTFTGWNTAANGSGTSYAVGATFAMGSANVTLYAQWTANNYSVIYNANGGTGTQTDSTVYHIGDTVTVKNQGTMAYIGYTFAGWNTAANGSGTAYAPAATFTMGSASVTLYAQWTANNYSVTYNANGGTGTQTDSTVYHIGNTVTARDQGTMAYTGYSFAGWNTAANGSGTSYAPAATFTMGSADVTLYAQWTANNYSVSYNANGGTGTQIDSTVYHIGDTVTVKNQGTMAYTGYTFAGWNTLSNGTGTSFTAGTAFTMGSANVALYAQWTANYAVTYDANDGTGTQTDSTVYHIGDTVTVKNQGTMAYTGYTFAGWNTLANGSGTSYAAGATFTMGSTGVTLYAQWTANNYSVTYNANGGTGTQTDSTIYHIGNTVTVRDQGTMAYAGYSFNGWNTAANGSGTAYAPEATFAMGSANVTLYAQWAANYAVTYNANGGTGTQTDSTVYHIGNTVTVKNQGTMAYTGYTFNGWNTADNGSGTAYAPAATFTMGSANVTLYAQWTVNDYSVIYDAHGGTGEQTDSTVYHIGNTVTVKNQGTMAYTGYTFNGWNTADNGSGTAYAPAATFTMGSANVTLYAQWTANNYSVTYNANGGTGTQTDSTIYHIGNTVTVRDQGTMAYAGYSFNGWNTAANGSGTAYAPEATFAMGSANVTLYAQWAANYAVTYNANGGTGTQTDSTVYHIGDTVTVKNQGTMAYTGYTFAGWNTAANGSGTAYAPAATFTMGSASVTLYAQWTANDYSVIYDANGGTGTQTDITIYHIGNTVTVRDQGTMVYTGYTFAGWNTAANGSGTSYAPAATFTMGSADVTLYAQWTANDYSVIYDA